MDRERRALIIATSALGGVAIAGASLPFLASLSPSEKVRAEGAPVEADMAALPPGDMMTVEWRGKPVWILHRTVEQLAMLDAHRDELADPASLRSEQPESCRNAFRSIKPQYWVATGLCTHLGCSPTAKIVGKGVVEGFECTCHGSSFDLAGRVFRNAPAPDNLRIPPYRYLGATRILIGEENA